MEYIAEQYRDLVEAYRAAEAETDESVWPERVEAINRIKVFDVRPQED